MTVSIETLTGLQRRLIIDVPVEAVEKAYHAKLQKVAQTAKVAGFRPGKVPPKIIENRYGSSIRQEVAHELMQSNLHEAVESHHLHIAGPPAIEVKEIAKGKPLQFVANFEVYPEIQLRPLTGETVERYHVTIQETDIDKMLESLQKQWAEWVTVDRAAQIGDRVVIDFVGTIDGKPFEYGDAKDFHLELGTKRMIDGFEEGLIGAKAKDTREIAITFPADYFVKEIAGKQAIFNVTVQEIRESKLATLDDAFAERMGVKTGGIQGLRERIKNDMEKASQRVEANRLKVAVLERLVAKNPIDVPQALVDVEIHHLQQMTRDRVSQQTQQPEEAKKLELPKEPYQEEAKKRVIFGLLLGEVIKQQGIQVDPDMVRTRIEEIAAAYQKPEEIISWYYNHKKSLAEIEMMVLEDQAVNHLLAELTVTDKSLTYEEAVQKGFSLDKRSL